MSCTPTTCRPSVAYSRCKVLLERERPS
jgi:hypothetical protein